MTSGTMPTPHAANAPLMSLPASGTLAVFSEDTQRQLRSFAVSQAAMAFGIEAMAARAIDSGESDQIDLMQALASKLGSELLELSNILGQIKVPNAA